MARALVMKWWLGLLKPHETIFRLSSDVFRLSSDLWRGIQRERMESSDDFAKPSDSCPRHHSCLIYRESIDVFGESIDGQLSSPKSTDVIRKSTDARICYKSTTSTTESATGSLGAAESSDVFTKSSDSRLASRPGIYRQLTDGFAKSTDARLGCLSIRVHPCHPWLNELPQTSHRS